MFEIWEESRLRECTFTTTWVLSLHGGKRRGARLASRANKDEIDQLKDRAEASQVTDVTELKKLLKQKVANGKSSGAKLSTVVSSSLGAQPSKEDTKGILLGDAEVQGPKADMNVLQAPGQEQAEDLPCKIVLQEPPVEATVADFQDVACKIVSPEPRVEEMVKDVACKMVSPEPPVEEMAKDVPCNIVSQDPPVEAGAKEVQSKIVTQDSPVEAPVPVFQDMPLVTPKRKAAQSMDEPSPLVHACQKRLRQKCAVPLTFTPEISRQLSEAVTKHGLGEQGNPGHRDFARTGVARCAICGVPRHTAKWVTRLTGHGYVKCSGSQCYCCTRATILLRCSRGLAVLQAVPDALRIVKMKCLELRSALRARDNDLCTCCCCVPVGEAP